MIDFDKAANLTRAFFLGTALIAPGLAAAVEDGGPFPAPGSCETFSQTQPEFLIPSFDGTPLAADVHLPGGSGPFPLIVRGHGYPGQRERLTADDSGNDPTKWSTLKKLIEAGFMVLVWDERGLGQSGGKVHLLDPEWEGRDVVALIESVKNHSELGPKLKRDESDNPVVGMSGGSYGGGIQWAALVADRLLGPSPENTTPTHYIDALAPEITWNSLEQSLIPGGVPKLFITTLLLGTGEVSSRTGGFPPPNDRFCPNTGGQEGLIETYLSGVIANGATPEAQNFLGKRSIAKYLAENPNLDVPPTFLAQGLRDTLFPPNEAIATFEAIRGKTEAKLMFFPTGHGWSSAPPQVFDDLLAWHRHTLLGEDLPARLTGNDFVYASHGLLAPDWGTDFVYAKFDDVKAMSPPIHLGPPAEPILLTLPLATSYADVTFFQGQIDDQQDPPHRVPTFDAPGTAVSWDLPVRGAEDVLLVGTPRITLDFTTTTNDLFLFGKLYGVDEEGRASVIYHQVMAKRVQYPQDDPPPHTDTVSFDLAALSKTLPVGHKLRVAVATSDAMHSASREPGVTIVEDATIDMPVVKGALQ